MNPEILAVFLMIVACCAQSGGRITPAPPSDAAGYTSLGRSLLSIFISILPEVKAKTRVPVLLPGKLPKPLEEARYAVVEKATTDKYAISLYYELGIGDAGFAALFAAEDSANYNPREFPNVREVKLAGGIGGFFRPVSCGAACAPANLWWKQGTSLYQIQLELLSTLPQDYQERIITEVADSAILAGPR
jgi:hypothetical protein